MPCRAVRRTRKKLKLLAHREGVLLVAGGQPQIAAGPCQVSLSIMALELKYVKAP
jgi:hypothetical protein